MHVANFVQRSKGNRVGRLSLLLFFTLAAASAASAQSHVFTKWTATYEPVVAGEPSEVTPGAIAADGQGNIYVTGTAIVGPDPVWGQEIESITIKYDSKGNTVWRVFLTSGAKDAHGVGVALDSAGNVYVLSHLYEHQGPEATDGVAIAKYTSAGIRQWVNFIAPSNLAPNYFPLALAVTPEGSVYIGYQHGSNAYIEKYGTNGKQQWLKTPSPTPYNINTPLAIRLDASENVYMLIFSFASTAPGLSQNHASEIFKFDANGNALAAFGADKLGTISGLGGDSVGGTSQIHAMPFRVDSQGNSYVAGGGTPNSSGVENRIVAKYNSSGAVEWFDTLGAPPDIAPNHIVGIVDLALSTTGEVFVAQTLPGRNSTNSGTDISVMKFDGTGRALWTSRYNGHSDDSGGDQAVAIATDSAGAAYVIGASSDTQAANYAQAFATIKYDSAGNRVWVERHETSGTPPSAPPIAFVLSGSDVVVTGLGVGPNQSSGWLTIDYGQ
jgi:hypothetical protein